jgi:dienelactone hydrolase
VLLFMAQIESKVSQGLAGFLLAAGYDGGAQAAYDCIKAFSETDFNEDLKKVDAPTLILHGDGDQIVPIGASAMLSAKIVKGASLKIYSGSPRGMCSTHKDQINSDLLAFCKQAASGASAQFADKTVTAGFTTAIQTSAAFSDEALPDAPCIGEDNVSASGN